MNATQTFATVRVLNSQSVEIASDRFEISAEHLASREALYNTADTYFRTIRHAFRVEIIVDGVVIYRLHG